MAAAAQAGIVSITEPPQRDRPSVGLITQEEAGNTTLVASDFAEPKWQTAVPIHLRLS
jgi:hypothetical protein